MESAAASGGLIARTDLLVRYGLLDTNSDPELQQLLQATALSCSVSGAFFAFIDDSQVKAASVVGPQLENLETIKELVLESAKSNDLLLSPQLSLPNIGFLAALPLFSADQSWLGSLCLWHNQPHSLGPEQIDVFRTLGHQFLLSLGRQLSNKISPQGRYEWNVSEDRIYWSSSLRQLIDAHSSIDSLSLRGYLQYIHPDDRKRAEHTFRKAFTDKQNVSWSFRTLDPEGHVRYYQDHISVVLDENQDVISIVGHVFERTGASGLTSLAQNNLTSNQLPMWRQFFESASVAMCVAEIWEDKNDVLLVTANSACASIFEMSLEESKGRFFNEDLGVDAEVVKEVIALLTSAVKSRQMIGMEKHRISKGQKEQWLKINVWYQGRSPQKRHRVSIMIEDVTEKTSIVQDLSRAILEAEANKSKLEKLVEAIPSGLLVEGVDHRVQFVNQSFCDMFHFGRRAHECIGESVDQLRTKSWHMFEDLDQVQAMFMNYMRHLVPELNRRLELRDGRTLEVDYTPLWAHEELYGHLWNFRDITHQIEREQLLEDQKVKLLHASKMSALGELAAGVAHEINNPLAILQARSAQIVRRVRNDTISESDLLASLNVVDTTVQRIAKIVRGLQLFSRDSENEPFSPASVEDIVNGALDLCKERFQFNNVRLEIECTAKANVLARSNQLSHAIYNLLINALDASRGADQPWVVLKTDMHKHEVVISVTDCGQGISASIIDKVMNPFFTTKEVGHGSGLGLSVSKGIVEAHQGRLVIDRNAKHTCFEIYLPIAASTPQEIPA